MELRGFTHLKKKHNHSVGQKKMCSNIDDFSFCSSKYDAVKSITEVEHERYHLMAFLDFETPIN